MKKLIIAAMFALGVSFANAQATQSTTAPATQTKSGVKTTTAAPAAQTPADAATKTASPKTEKASTTAAPIKKDGTPDKRYSVNKKQAAAKGPVKKDGTPDKRYKTNKTDDAKPKADTPDKPKS